MNRVKQEISKTTRDFSSDNIRFLLIVLVVFGHLIKMDASFPHAWKLYKIIYSFHMPAFLFLTGFYSKYNPRKILFQWCCPYIFFQGLYLAFVRYILKDTAYLQFTTPYWILWYLLVCIYYQLLIPLYDALRGRGAITIFGVALLISLLVGMDRTIGDYLSFSRFIVFQPWFLAGFYTRKYGLYDKWNNCTEKPLLSIISTLLVVFSVLILIKWDVSARLLYGSMSYSEADATLFDRVKAIFMAFSWIVFLFFSLRPLMNKHIPFITKIGQNTLPVYLFHGFFVKLLRLWLPDIAESFHYLVVTSFFVVFLFGNGFCRKIVSFTFFPWVEKLLFGGEFSNSDVITKQQ